ncbi:uncharacterized protein LOC121249177 [Juglans microcarpa x Juglans regia]|uniref:uncharacterized protein LOC121249177 n=1 Tax=Juglans microcarpa x Juglans regia TaxID=2249226 RepID=UPI001B7E14F9|nr:uncharacterized protein LOC121249177 [Juglans microcarpa x Juglans regia]
MWCGDQTLERAFPALYRIAVKREASVADVRLFSHGSYQWNILFSRDFHDCELSIVAEFFSSLYSTGTLVAQRDRLKWRSNNHKLCTVKAYYNILTTQDHTLFPWKNIWRSHVPFKVAFFVWGAALEKILNTDNLRKRGCVVMDWCYMCKKNGESVVHLLLHSEVTWVLWDEIFQMVDVAWVMPMRVVDLLGCWRKMQGCHQVATVWKMIPLCIM